MPSASDVLGGAPSAEQITGFDMSLEAWLDRLMRGQYASANVAQAILNSDYSSIPEAAWKGVTGQEKGSYRQIAENQGIPAPFWAGLAGDVLLDPTTYIPVGAVAKTITKPIREIPAVAKGLTALRDTPIVQGLGKALSPTFRPTGVEPTLWNKLLKAKTLASNVKRLGTLEAKTFSEGIVKDIQGLMKKGTLSQDDLTKVIASVERGSIKFGLPQETQGIFDKLTKYWDNIATRREGIGKTLLKDEEYNYFLRSLSKEEREAAKKTGMDIVGRDFATNSPSDIARKYVKFKDLDTGAERVAKISDSGALPLSMRGISKEHLGEMFEGQVRDLADLQSVAKQYGIKVEFRSGATVISDGKRVAGYLSPNENKIVIATGGKATSEWLSTVTHELAHHVHGTFGGWAELYAKGAETVAANGITRVSLPRGDYDKLLKKIRGFTTVDRTRFYDTFGERVWGVSRERMREIVAGKPNYYNKPTEIWARYLQLVKKNPELAAREFPQLFETAQYIEKYSPAAWRIMTDANARTAERAGRTWDKLNPRNIFMDKKGKLFESSQADAMEMKAAHEASLAAGLERGAKGYIPEFSSDIPALTYVGGARQVQVEAGHRLIRLVNSSGLSSPTEIDGWVKSTIPELKGRWINPVIEEEITKAHKAFIGDKASSELLKGFDNMQNLWKTWTLGVFPAYHARNMLGNLWNNYLAGVINPKVYIEAKRIQDLAVKGELKGTDKLLYDLAQKQGVLGRGIMRSEIPSVLPTAEKTLGEKAYATAEYLPRKGMEMIGGPIEDNARLAHFIDKLEKGWKPGEAAQSVKKHLFDYDELTDFERNVLRRFMPFYTWTRKNIPLQLEALINKTGKVLPIEKARQSALAGADNPDTSVMPEYIKERMPFVFRGKSGDLNYFPLESYLPLADLQKLGPKRLADVGGELLSPIFKVPIELTENRSWYFKEPIEKYRGETREFLRMDMPVRLSYVASQIRLLSEIDRMLGHKNIPTNAPPELTKSEALIRFATGVKIGTYDVEKAKKIKFLDLQKDLIALKVGLKRAEKYNRPAEQSRIAMKIMEMDLELSRLK
jgi:hypothetical protein